MGIDNQDFFTILAGLRKPLYLHDLAVLKQFGDTGFKLTQSRCVRNKGVESPEKQYVPKGSVNEEKLDNNIARARSNIGILATVDIESISTADSRNFR